MASRISKALLLVEGQSFEKTRRSQYSGKGQKMKARYCRKTRYRYHRSAVDVMLAATYSRAAAKSSGVLIHRTEARIYWHEHCNSYHLTSQPLHTTVGISYAA
jgi:hypothetical protein